MQNDMKNNLLWVGIGAILSAAYADGHELRGMIPIRHVAARNSYITYVVDHDNTPFIIKQKKRYAAPVLACKVALEAFGAYVAQAIDVACHEVSVIPASKNVVGKKQIQLPATLHTVVPGTSLDQYDNCYYGIDVYQGYKNSDGKKLMRTIIRTMAHHPQLPAIIALDIFIANADRVPSNIFYNQTKDKFYLIDMERIYKYPVARMVHMYIQKMVARDPLYLREHRVALQELQATLERLMERFSVQKLRNLIHFFLRQTGCYTPQTLRAITPYMRVMVRNYRAVKKLIELLQTILNSALQ